MRNYIPTGRPCGRPPGVGDEKLEQCPFYMKHYQSGNYKTRVIVCEGLEPGCTIHLNYNGKAKQERQLNEYCRKSYKYCEVYRMLIQLYEDGAE